mgnify:FL=1
MKLYNSMTGRKEEFIPLDGKNVKMYACGITVYDLSHIGHARQAIAYAMVADYLRYRGYNVKYVRNYTDVDDKIIDRANKLGKDPLEFSREQIEETEKDMANLHITDADVKPKASENIENIIEFVQGLIDKGHAYPAENGDVYFNVRSFPGYGKLSHRKVDELLNGVRKDVEEGKHDPIDFALWKAAKPGEISWKSPWGEGRPGWHIECSTMVLKNLGETIDIHGGGKDLIFPHHENEIAQSECANGCKFVNYWLHNGFVTINKEKMSKSLGNFLTIDDLLKKYDANTIRFFILTNHYRMPVEFSDEALSSAQAGVKRMLNAKRTKLNEDLDITQTEEYKAFVEAMDDDLNTSKALAVLFDLTNKANKDDKNAFTILFKLASVLGFTFDKPQLSEEEIQNALKKVSEVLNKEFSSMNDLISYRKEARDAKNWDIADKIRITLDECGIVLKDTKDGTTFEAK